MNAQQFTGRENDGTGIYYYRARYYSPNTGRFIAEDPIGWNSGQANNYVYVAGNPVSFRDPSGTFINFPGIAIGAVSGAIGGYISSDSSPIGALSGALAGAVVGLVMPAESGVIGAADGGWIISVRYLQNQVLLEQPMVAG